MTYCIHVYQNVGAELCPYCGKETRENDWETSSKMIRTHYEEGHDLDYVCKECGGTIRMWWSI
jgi:uncharacterized protein with PIN domain